MSSAPAKGGKYVRFDDQASSSHKSPGSFSNLTIRSLLSTQGVSGKPKTPKRVINIGIDFAACLTTVSELLEEAGTLSTLKSYQNVTSHTSWQTGHQAIQLPSLLTYLQEDSKVIGFLWGLQAISKHHPTTIRGFKALLHQSSETEEMNTELQVLAKNLDKDELQFSVDYLKEIHRCVMDQLMKDRGEKVMDSVKVHWQIGVPPCFTRSAQQKLKNDCCAAGFKEKDLSFGSEVEAMIIARAAAFPGSIEVFKVHIVVDAGGLTVDAASYLVTSLNPFRAYSLCTSEGITNGGMILDRKFARLVDRKLKKSYPKSSVRQELWEVIVNEFESHFKCGFDGKQDFEIPADHEDLEMIAARLDIEVEDIFISSEEIRKEVFIPIVYAIIHLITQQSDQIENQDFRRKSDIIIHLCGGLMSNPYISRRVVEHFRIFHYHIDIVPYQKTLTSQGLALMAGMQTEERVSRLSIGVETEIRCTANYEDCRTDLLHAGRGPEYMVKVVQWIAAYGQTITAPANDPKKPDKKISVLPLPEILRFHGIYPSASGEASISQRIYVSNRYVPEKSFSLLDDIPEEDIEVIEMKWPITAEDFEQIESTTVDGVPFPICPQYQEFSARARKVLVKLSFRLKRLKQKNPFLEFDIEIPRCPTLDLKEASPRQGRIVVQSKTHWELNLSGTLGSRAPDKALVARDGPQDSIGKLSRISEEDFADDELERNKEAMEESDRRAAEKFRSSQQSANKRSRDDDSEDEQKKPSVQARKRIAGENRQYTRNEDVEMTSADDSATVDDGISDNHPIFGGSGSESEGENDVEEEVEALDDEMDAVKITDDEGDVQMNDS